MSTNDAELPPEDRTAAAFRKVLDSHGYGFQHALMRHIHGLHAVGEHGWQVESQEFPLTFKGASTHIDFVLRLKDNSARLVCECKRANPALIDWCFVGVASYARDVQLELVRRLRAGPNEACVNLPRNALIGADRTRTYNLAFALKSDVPGDAAGQGRGGIINDAIAQVFRGANGLIEFLSEQTHFLAGNEGTAGCYVIPVLFTTARLWVSDVVLEDSDVGTGKTPSGGLQPTPWLWLKQNISPALRHSLPLLGTDEPDSLGVFARHEYERSVAIVSTADWQVPNSGIMRFLRRDWWPFPRTGI